MSRVYSLPPAEEKLFEDSYRAGGAAAVRHFMPHFKLSKTTIQSIANHRGVTVDKGYLKRVVQTYYPEGGVDAVRAVAPWLTVSSVYAHAARVGVKRLPPSQRTEQPPPPPAAPELSLDPEPDTFPPKQVRVPAGQWRAEVPHVRWVFDLGVGA